MTLRSKRMMYAPIANVAEMLDNWRANAGLATTAKQAEEDDA